MRRLLFASALLTASALVPAAHAQNYVQVRNYSGPGTIVNMDALGQPDGSDLNPPPVYERQLPPPVQMPQAIQLVPPPPMQIMSAPNAASPQQDELPRVQPESLASAKQRASQGVKPEPFMARDVASMAPPQTAASKRTSKDEMFEKAVSDDDVSANKPAENKARTLLAQAREQAETETAEAKREVVLFDEQPSKAAKKEPAKMAAAAPIPLTPQPLTTPPAMPAPIQNTKALEPMSVIPAKTAMLEPTSLPDVTPASIPDQNSLQKAETKIDNFEAYRLLFGASSTDLSASEQAVLDNVIKKMKAEDGARVQLRAYANGTPDTSAQARRLSLSRALKVRSYMIQNGIAAARLDVRALGMGSASMGDTVGQGTAPPDRLDMIFVR